MLICDFKKKDKCDKYSQMYFYHNICFTQELNMF